MNALMKPNSIPLTMTSREIAELASKDHFHVMRDLRKLQEQLGEMFGGSIQNWIHPQNGQTYEEFVLNKDTTLTLLLGYDAVARMKVVKRWQELEAGAPSVDPMRVLADPAAMRSLLLTYTEKVLSLEQAVDTMKPKVNAFERIAVATDGAVCLRVAAKLAQVPEKQYIEFLQQEGWIFRHHHSRTLMGYTDKERAGYLELKRTEVTRDDGSSKTVEQVLITPKGLAKSTELIERKAPWLCKRPVVPQAEMVPA